MINDLRDRVDLWLQRTEKDMKSFDGHGYIYGLRMITAFAHVLKHCLLAHNQDKQFGKGAGATAGANAAQQEQDQEIYLSVRNGIAQNRCNCEECTRLKQSNKLHLASLPIWLCMKYHDKERLIEHRECVLAAGRCHRDVKQEVEERKKELTERFGTDVEKRKAELISLFDGFPSSLLPPKGAPKDAKYVPHLENPSKTTEFTADLFCVWPHCKNYEITRYEFEEVTREGETLNEKLKAVKKHLDAHSDLKNYHYMVVKFVEKQYDKLSVFDVIVARTTVAKKEGQDAGSSNDTYDFNGDGVDYTRFLSLYNHIVDDLKPDKQSMLEALGEDETQLNEPCSAKVSEVNKLCILLKILKQGVTRQDKKSADLATFEGTDIKSPLFSTIVQKFGAREKDGEKKKVDVNTLNRKLVELSDGCVECFRDECISFMSDLRHVVSEVGDYDNYSKCQDTIAQFIGNIKIDLSPMDSLLNSAKNDGVESAIIQR